MEWRLWSIRFRVTATELRHRSTCWQILDASLSLRTRPRQVASGDQSRADTGTGGRHRKSLGDAGARIDAKASGQYRRRATELREELAEAVRLNDTGRAARIRAEIEFLRDQIAAAVGLSGRSRKAASHSERARLMVTKAIKAAIAKVRARDASAGRYLATSIKTGNYCTYDPDSAPPISWHL